MIENQLQNIHALNGASSEQLSHLMAIWRDAQKRVYSYLELSAVAYFKYLELCGDKEVLCSCSVQCFSYEDCLCMLVCSNSRLLEFFLFVQS
jgi:hypothetical protein